MDASPKAPIPPLWLLATLIGTATIGIHIFAPALPVIARDFHTTPAIAQATISLYMVALAVGQIFYGPLSDWFGRRPVLIWALTFHIASGVAAALATTLDALLVARVAQGASACAAFVLGRAIVNDVAARDQAASVISAVNALLLVSPAIAPILGVWLTEVFGWRMIPLVLSAWGLAALLGAWRSLRETVELRPRSVAAMASDYRRLLASPRFISFVVGGALSTTTMFALLVNAPFIVSERLHRPLEEVGYVYTVLIIAVMIGNTAAGRLLRRFPFENIMIAGCLLGAVGAAFIVGANFVGALTTAKLVAGGALYSMMSGLMAPLSLTGAVELAPGLRGTASGIYGFCQICFGALSVMVVGSGGDVAHAMGLVLAICAVSALAIFVSLKAMRRPVT